MNYFSGFISTYTYIPTSVYLLAPVNSKYLLINTSLHAAAASRLHIIYRMPNHYLTKFKLLIL